jgi:hypothetical protein
VGARIRDEIALCASSHRVANERAVDIVPSVDLYRTEKNPILGRGARRTRQLERTESRSGGGGGWLAEATRTGHHVARSVSRATIYHPHYHPDPSLITADGAAALSAARPRGPRCVWPCGRC